MVGIKPTGWSYNESSDKGPKARAGSILTIKEKRGEPIKGSGEQPRLITVGVPYSEHCSYPELIHSVAVLQPHHIIPTVDCHQEAKVKNQLELLSDGVKQLRLGRS